MANKLDQLTQKRNQLNARIAAIKARKSQQDRKRDTRRKILIGAAILEKVNRGDYPQEQLQDLMDGFLEKAKDRELFGLPSKASEPTVGA